MSADTNIFLKLLEKESQSTPVSSEILDVLSEDEGVFKRYEDVVFERLMDGMKDDSVDSFSHYYETIENLMNKSYGFVYYSSIWQGRVLEILKDTVLARLTKKEEDKEFFVEIEKSKLEESQLEHLAAGSLFSCSFGYKGSNSSEQFCKIVFHPRAKPSPEAIQQISARMKAGLEHFYESKD